MAVLAFDYALLRRTYSKFAAGIMGTMFCAANGVSQGNRKLIHQYFPRSSTSETLSSQFVKTGLSQLRMSHGIRTKQSCRVMRPSGKFRMQGQGLYLEATMLL